MPNKNHLKIGVLETGRPPEELAAEYGDYPGMVASWLEPFDATFRAYAVLDGELPNSPTDCDLWVITGSRFAVYEDHAWIGPIESFIRDCRAAGSKMIGICFGHQLIAQALGGRVEKSEKGWALGVHEYSTAGWPTSLGPNPGSIRIQAFHQDQVISPPEGAITVATSDFCEFAGLWYPGFALTVQGHPEFPTRYISDLMEFRRGTVLPEALVDAAQSGLAVGTNRSAFASYIQDNLDSI